MDVFGIWSETSSVFCITASQFQMIELWDVRRNFEMHSQFPVDKFMCPPYHNEEKLKQ